MSTMTSPAVGTQAVTFTTPPPGFAPAVDFELASVEGAVGLYTLRDRHGVGLRLFLVDPGLFLPDYAPRFSTEQLEPLGATTAEGLDVYVVATIGEDGPVVNLMAPILLDPASGAAVQVILDDRWPLRAALVAPAA